ncbi:MAG: c-type cytochrome [Sphingomicrobium sp.]
MVEGDGEQPLVRTGIVAGTFVAGIVVAALGLMAIMPRTASTAPGGTGIGGGAAVSVASFTPPALADIPDGKDGDAIRRGLAIFDDPRNNAGQFVGNAMACKNCHLDSGRKADSSPMWAAWVAYPQYRKKNDAINTMHDRIRGCFLYSMDAGNSPSGGAPPDDSDVYRDLEAYFFWLAKGAPTGVKLKGANYPKPVLPAGGYDPAHGATLYASTCAACHGAEGQGAKQPGGKIVYPPLWGPDSYNWGAGMARIDLAAGFIRANMPQDKPGSLSDAQAWDVAAFIDSHERPRDPRQNGSVAANAAAKHKDEKSYYGKIVGGQLLGSGIPKARR